MLGTPYIYLFCLGPDNSIVNTSKQEISLALAFLKKHKKHSKYIQTFVNNDGQQYRINNLSADITCHFCKISIFVEGNFKYLCDSHENPSPTKDIKQRHKNGCIKRATFEMESGYTLFTIGMLK